MSRSSTSSSDAPGPEAPVDPVGPVGWRRWFPTAGVGALLLVLALNTLAGVLIARTTWLPSEPRALVTKQVDELRASEDVWLLGSSTLAQGIDPELFVGETGLDTAFFKLGSAGPVSLTEMALAGLEGNDAPPRAIYIFAFKDLFNLNRPTIENDRRYVKSLNSPSFADVITSYAVVYNYRHSLKSDGTKVIARAISPDTKKDTPLDEIKVRPMDNSELVSLMTGGQDYAFSLGSMDKLAAVCKDKGIRLYLVITPTAEAAIKWQDKYVPDLPYDALIEQVRSIGKEQGFGVIDYTGLFPSTTLYFRDPYHIREPHMKELTRAFVREVQADLGGASRTAD